MIELSIILFLLFCALESLGATERQSDGLALAQLSRGKGKRSLQEGIVRASPISKPEDLTFEPPPLSRTHAELGDGDVDLLRNLRLLDTVLLASVDGRFHAVNRSTGRSIWSMEDDAEAGPSQSLLHNLVRTDHNLPPVSSVESESQELYIIEPQSGDIFILASGSGLDENGSPEPLRRLPYSVPQLVEHSPFSFDDPDRVFVGKKETSIIEIDLDGGIVKSVMGGTSSWLHENEDETDDDWSRMSSRIVQIGRTDYSIKVISHNVVLQTLSFSTYGPNNMNKQLQSLWKRTPDDIYLQPSWDGQTYAFETLGESAIWAKPFKQPIVAVFDVVMQDSGVGINTKPIVLLQPRPKLQELFPTRAAQLGGIRDKTVVNKIGNSLYAMGHLNYPLVNLAEVYLELEGTPDAAHNGRKCEGVNCFLGVKYAERDGAKSRISRLIDPPPEGSSTQSVTTRDLADQDGTIPDDGFEDPVPTTLEIAALPFPSRLSATASLNGEQLVGLMSQIENNRPKPGGALGWTMLLPFVGGFLAVWFILRKLINLNNNPNQHLIQPLQDPSPHLEATRPPVTPSRTHSRLPSHATVAYPAFVGTSSDNASSTTAHSPRGVESVILNEKEEHLSEKADPDVNISLVLDDPRGGPGLGVSIDAKEGEDSDKDDGDPQDGGKKKRRRNRGKKNKRPAGATDGAQGADAPLEGPSPADSGMSSGGYVMVDKEPVTSAKMELPMPVTTSASSLVVGTKVLGYGSHGTIVYEGSLQGRAVAVKRLLNDFTTLASHEVSVLLHADDHPNVIRYFFSMTRESFLYIALELCPCSLADLIETPNKHPEIMSNFEPKKALSQITQGLRHLHNLKIIHRDIKPQNILVSGRKGDGSHRMLISDFGLCKKLEVDQTSFLPTMAAGGGHGAVAGTPGWRAPEILRGDVSLDEDAIAAASDSRGASGSKSDSSNGNTKGIETRLTKSVDIFALGCIFYYTLVNGEHPFGEKYIREINILGGKFYLDGLEKFGEEGVEAQHLIEWMIDQDSKARPDTDTILLHPFFWTPARRLNFLQDASDRFEIMEREPREPGLVALETGAYDVVGSDWHRRLDKIFIDNLGKYRKYQGSSVQDLLRALRNKKHHYQDLPENVKRHLGPLPDGFLSYFTRRFPNLLMHVHSVIDSLPLRDEAMFKTYFELEA